MDKPGLLVVGVLPDWDLEALAQRFTLHLLYEAPDRTAFLAQHGPSLNAGDSVLAGSFTRPRWVERGDTVHADYGTLGTSSCRFA